MKRLRTRVRLTAKDWYEVYAWLGDVLDQVAKSRGREQRWVAGRLRTILRKIGADGMAARDRGVAPARKGRRS